MTDFPGEALASSLRNLLVLDLSRNEMERLPMAIALLTSLKALDVSENYISLVESDIHLLAALLNLQTFSVMEQGGMGYRTLLQDSLSHLQTIQSAFPM